MTTATTITLDLNTLKQYAGQKRERKQQLNDKSIPGLIAIASTGGTVTLYAYGRVRGGQPRRVKLERFNPATYSRTAIKDKCADTLKKMRDGVDPNAERRAQVLEMAKASADGVILNLTVQQAAARMIELRGDYAPATVDDILRAVKRLGWGDKRLVDITEAMCLVRFSEITQDSKTSANRCFQWLHGIFNYMHTIHEQGGVSPFQHSPVRKFGLLKLWHAEKRRKTSVEPEGLADLYAALLAMRNDTSGSLNIRRVGCYYTILLFTGFRAGGIMNLGWMNVINDDPKTRERKALKTTGTVDLEQGVMRLKDTKNRQDYDLPLSSEALQAFMELREMSAPINPWVFPAKDKNQASSYEYYRKVAAAFLPNVTPGDYRRRFITTAQKYVSYYDGKYLMGHSMGDVTGGYIVPTQEELRAGTERVAQHYLSIIRQGSAGIDRTTA